MVSKTDNSKLLQKVRDAVWTLDITTNDKLMLLCICYHYNTKLGYCVLKDETVMKETNLGRSSVKRSRMKLEDIGVIITSKTTYKINRYSLSNMMVQRELSEEGHDGSERTHDGPERTHDGSERTIQYNSITNSITNSNPKSFSKDRNTVEAAADDEVIDEDDKFTDLAKGSTF